MRYVKVFTVHPPPPPKKREEKRDFLKYHTRLKGYLKVAGGTLPASGTGAAVEWLSVTVRQTEPLVLAQLLVLVNKIFF